MLMIIAQPAREKKWPGTIKRRAMRIGFRERKPFGSHSAHKAAIAGRIAKLVKY